MKITSGRARFQCKFCYNWSPNSSSKNHYKGPSCLYQLNVSKLRMLKVRNSYPCLLCFQAFKLKEIGHHYVENHAHSDLKMLGLHPEALTKKIQQGTSQLNDTYSAFQDDEGFMDSPDYSINEGAAMDIQDLSDVVEEREDRSGGVRIEPQSQHSLDSMIDEIVNSKPKATEPKAISQVIKV